MWACGVVLFILLSGQPPFFNADMRALYRSIMRGSFAFQDPIWDSVSDQCALPLPDTACDKLWEIASDCMATMQLCELCWTRLSHRHILLRPSVS